MLTRLVEGFSQDGQKGSLSDFVSAEQGDRTQWITLGICHLGILRETFQASRLFPQKCQLRYLWIICERWVVTFAE
ncbi:TPA: hypothetical protein L6B20_14380 [Pseudomonas aeruginosa]|nr:hypothetical protein [Pseudomonas aeruginosa]